MRKPEGCTTEGKETKKKKQNEWDVYNFLMATLLLIVRTTAVSVSCSDNNNNCYYNDNIINKLQKNIIFFILLIFYNLKYEKSKGIKEKRGTNYGNIKNGVRTFNMTDKSQ